MSSTSSTIDLPRTASAPKTTAPPGSRLLLAFVALGLLAVAMPALIVKMPPLLDLPNHYARIWLLAGGVNEPPLSKIYTVDWSAAWTNIGVDLAAQILGKVIPGESLGPLFLAAALVAPPLGAVMFHRSLHGGLRWWQVAMPIAAFSTTLLAGFLNYQIGLGLALAAAAADPALERRLNGPQFMLARLAIAVSLLVVHIFAMGFYGALLGGLALGPRLADLFDPKAFRRAFLRGLAAVAVIAVPLVAYRMTAAAVPGGGEWAPIWGPWNLKYKLEVLYCAFGTYSVRADGLTFGALLATVVAAAAARRLRLHQGLVLVALALAVVALLLPTWAAQTGWIDTRVPIMSLLILMCAADPEALVAPRWRTIAASLLLVLALGRAAWIGGIWIERQSDADSITRALRHVPAGAAVMPLDHWPSRRGMRTAPVGRYFHMGASFYHAYTLAVMERRAFSPLIFTMTGKQPLRVQAPWTDISVPNGGRSPTLQVLVNPSRRWLRIAPYLAQWRQRFDYALMLNADMLEPVDKEPLPDNMRLVADEGFARLYRIEKEPPAAEPEPEDQAGERPIVRTRGRAAQKERPGTTPRA